MAPSRSVGRNYILRAIYWGGVCSGAGHSIASGMRLYHMESSLAPARCFWWMDVDYDLPASGEGVHLCYASLREW